MGRRRKGDGDDVPRLGGVRDPLRTYMWCGPCGLNHEPHCSFLLGGTENLSYEERQRGLRDRIRILTPRMGERERALFGLVWLQLDLIDELHRGEAHWVLDVLGSLVGAFEAAEAPAGTEPP